MEYIDCEQLGAEWHQLHLGRATASHAADILNFTLKGDEGSKRRDYRAQKVAEILTGQLQSEGYVSPEMQWGIDHEGDARRAYALGKGLFVEQIGFVIGNNDRTGCSPDGLVGRDGLLEVKCPKTSTHLKWMFDARIPDEYLPQCRFALMVCQDRQWVDFVSYDPRLPLRYRMFTVRLMREDAECPAMMAAADRFLEDVDATIEKLNEIAPPVEEPEAQPEGYGELGLTDEDLKLI